MKHFVYEYITINSVPVLSCSGEYNFSYCVEALFQFAMYVVVLLIASDVRMYPQISLLIRSTFHADFHCIN